MSDGSGHDVAVIVVGLNASAFVKQCFSSLEAATWDGVDHEVIYVDNGSTDGSVSMVRSSFPGVRVLANETNVGFCRAANQGAAMARSRHYFFLNDDTIVLKDAIPLLARFLDASPEVGAAGSRLLNPDLTEQWSGRRFPSPANFVFGRRSVLTRYFPDAAAVSRYLYKDQVNGHRPFEVDWVSAAAVMVPAPVFQAVGGFAEDYYYWHEAIFCDRIRKARRQVVLDPRSRIIHFEGHGADPRPYHVRQRHIVNFHLGAYRCYCEHYSLGRWHPLRWLAAAALSTRAATLLAANRVTSLAGRA